MEDEYFADNMIIYIEIKIAENFNYIQLFMNSKI